VEQITPKSATLVTLAGHPLAGAIRFLAEQRGDLLRFEVQVYDRPANLADWFVMRSVGDGLQARSWESLVQAMVPESGGAAVTPVRHEETYLDEEQADRVEEWVRELVVERKHADHGRPRAPRPERSASEPVETEATL
jgi:NADH dehydrogenase